MVVVATRGEKEGRKEGRKEQGGRYYYRHRFDPIWWWLENGLDAISSSISPPLLPKGQATRYLSLASSIHPRDRREIHFERRKTRGRVFSARDFGRASTSTIVYAYIYMCVCVCFHAFDKRLPIRCRWSNWRLIGEGWRWGGNVSVWRQVTKHDTRRGK